MFSGEQVRMDPTSREIRVQAAPMSVFIPVIAHLSASVRFRCKYDDVLEVGNPWQQAGGRIVRCGTGRDSDNRAAFRWALR